MKKIKFEELLGKTIVSVEVNQPEDKIIFKTNEKTYMMYHSQDCCESVHIESIEGDIQSLVGNPILVAEESSNSEDAVPDHISSDYSYTWTFYKLATINGLVDIRWFGSSNGRYSESVDLYEEEILK